MKSLSRRRPYVQLTVTAYVDTGELVGAVSDCVAPGIPREVQRLDMWDQQWESMIDQFWQLIEQGPVAVQEPPNPHRRNLFLIGGTEA